MIDDRLSSTDHIATTARPCRFALYIIRNIRPFLTEQTAQLLVQALVLSRLDYCNALLVGLLACNYQASATDPECSSQSGLQRAEESSCHTSFHQLALAANSRSHHIQDANVCLQDNHWRCTNIPKLASSDLRVLQKLAFCK